MVVDDVEFVIENVEVVEWEYKNESVFDFERLLDRM